jgi:SecY interacting protein Syd
MTSTNANLVQLIRQFAQQYIADHQTKYGSLPKVEYDIEWPSPCLQDGNLEPLAPWQPVVMDQALDFANIESALELELHPDIKQYYSSIYADSIPASSKDGYLELLFAWNQEDLQRLQENIIGHILMKRRLKQNISIFFAVTDEPDLILSLDNSTGAIGVERVGCEPHKVIAASMAEFIRSLTPFIASQD